MSNILQPNANSDKVSVINKRHLPQFGRLFTLRS
jgi:hypothetical protein